jgi:hypothetical protein
LCPKNQRSYIATRALAFLALLLQGCYNINAMFRKQVKCCNCGFLALYEEMLSIEEEPRTLEDLKYLKELEIFGYHECTQRGRDRIANGTHADLSILTCTRRVWSSYELRTKKKREALDFLNSKRKCPYFFPYTPSYSPAEHRELQREAKTRSLLIKGMLLAAVIGAVAAIVAQFLAR